MMMKAGAPIPPNTRCARYERRCEIAPGLKVFSVIVYDFKDYVTI